MSDVTMTEAELKAKIDAAVKEGVETYEKEVASPKLAKIEAHNQTLLGEVKAEKAKNEAIAGFSPEAIKLALSPENKALFDKIGKLDPKDLNLAISLTGKLKDDPKLGDAPDIQTLVKAELAQYDAKHKAELDAKDALVAEANKERDEAAGKLNDSRIRTEAQRHLIEAKAIPAAADDLIASMLATKKIKINPDTDKIEIIGENGEVITSGEASKHGQPMQLDEFSTMLQGSKPYLFGATKGSGNTQGGGEGGTGADKGFDPFANDVDPAALGRWASANPVDYQKAVDEGKL